MEASQAMSVIAEFQIPSRHFELGQILSVEGQTSIELETLVPVGQSTVPLFWVHNSTRESFVEQVQNHSSVTTAREVDVFEDRTLFTLDWDAGSDVLFRGIQEFEGQVISAVGTQNTWEFELRFDGHESLSAFTEYCESEGISLDITRVYNPTDPENSLWYGLTEPQREAIMLACREGYYDIPRGCTTKELADQLGISDQAVTERLRRAIDRLVTKTLIDSE